MKLFWGLFLTLGVCASISTQAKLVVYEYGNEGDGDYHGDLVAQIACRNLKAECGVVYAPELSVEDVESLNETLEPNDVVNMSFSFQYPERPPISSYTVSDAQQIESHQEAVQNFEAQKASFLNMFASHPETTFVAASGNGYMMMGMMTPDGVPLGKYKSFPALDEVSKNLIVVGSVSAEVFDLKKQISYSLTSYSNYGVENVDVAAPVELSDEGEKLEGTSFAAPYVARLVKNLELKHSELKPEQIREILIKSSYIEDLDATLEESLRYTEEPESSLIHKVQNTRKLKERRAYIKELGSVMLVKSGGVVVDDLAYRCAEVYMDSRKLVSITNACLEAHAKVLEATPVRQAKLLQLWQLRGLETSDKPSTNLQASL